MAVDGKWDVTLNSPMGEQAMAMELKSDGSSLSGSLKSPMGAMDITEGSIDGDAVTWKVALEQPMAMTLEFAATIDGDTMSGEAQMGTFGAAPFTGKRAG
jgi:hypothetical protein